ncbi:DUF4334 domain-containing protein [Candidatus Bathyarchaeota archaeon]|nr:DUF4334 domain-containing protein [Candidatus Bathyarchaeota archaeon]
MKSFNELLKEEKTTTEDALHLFDEMDVMTINNMFGRWQGSGFCTQHPLDGLLEMFNWYGKEFIDINNVHPLLFLDRNNKIFKVDPKKIPMSLAVNLPIPKNKISKFLFLSMKLILATTKTKARVRMMEHRGKISATMIYDDLPIFDVFRKIDNNTVLGLMDLKGVEQPFFFVLKRDCVT